MIVDYTVCLCVSGRVKASDGEVWSPLQSHHRHSIILCSFVRRERKEIMYLSHWQK